MVGGSRSEAMQLCSRILAVKRRVASVGLSSPNCFDRALSCHTCHGHERLRMVYIYIYIYKHAYICLYIDIDVCVCACMCVYINMYICILQYTYIRTYVRTYIHADRQYMCICI